MQGYDVIDRLMKLIINTKITPSEGINQRVAKRYAFAFYFYCCSVPNSIPF